MRLVARGFGSDALAARPAAIGLVLGVLVYLFFVRFLNVNLPAGLAAAAAAERGRATIEARDRARSGILLHRRVR